MKKTSRNERSTRKSVTIVDVARHAGVSFKTVSRVLNNEPNVRESKRAAVMASIDKLGYQRNRMAQTLRKQEPQFVALLFQNPNMGYVNSIQLGAMERCRHDGCHLIVENCTDHERSIQELISEPHLVGAMLTPPLSDDEQLLQLLESHEIPFVRMGTNLDMDRAPLVTMDDEQAAFEVTDYLLSIGHRRIGFIAGPPEHSISELRHVGYRRALAARGVTYEDQLVTPGDFSYESGLAGAERLLDLGAPPTAIFASNDDMAAATLAVAYKRNIDVPAELSVAGFDDTLISQVIYPQLTTIAQPIAKMAEACVDLLLQITSGVQVTSTHVRLEHRLVIRQSTAPPKDRRRVLT
ncbi:MAG: LacI family DNA-binding transcriptional regulator [Pseudomonadota bacterium]